MALEDLGSWVARARAAITEFVEGFERRMGYEPEDQEVLLANAEEMPGLARAPEDAKAFFREVSEVAWPDVWNGYFLGPGGEMARRDLDDDPGWVQIGSERHRVFQIGSDGGGAYFLLDLEANGAVIRVADGVLVDGTLIGIVEEVAPNLNAFLELLIQNVSAATEGREPAF